MADLGKLLTPELFAQLEEYLVTGTDPDGNTCYTGLDMTQSRYVAGTGADQDERITQRYVLFVPYNAPHTEMLNEYIAYCFS